MPVAVEKCDVDASAEIVALERDFVGFVKQVGVEHDRAIGPIGNLHRLRLDFLEPFENFRFIPIAVVVLNVPRSWRFPVVHD